MQIKVIKHEALDSTSEHAQKLLREKTEQAPFAVFAQTQSKGRGRMARPWVSPKGNLYATFALPVNIDAKRNAMEAHVMPLRVGVLLARWLDQEFAIQVRLKWPNDLMVGGKKLGGILCEATWSGDKCEHVIIGIGLNVNVTPEVSEHEAVSLVDILDSIVDLDFLQKSLVEYFERHWAESNVPPEHLIKEYQTLNTGWGQLWRDDKAFYLEQGLSPDGSLELLSLVDHKFVSLSSAEHRLRWCLQKNPNDRPPPLIFADVGNTRIKIAVCNKDGRFDSDIYVAQTKTELKKALAAAREKISKYYVRSWPVYFASVSPEKSDMLLLAAATNGMTAFEFRKRSARANIKHYKIKQMGIDRLCAIEGFCSEATRKDLGVIVSFGTATTLDCVGTDWTHLGGWIIPGVQTMFDSLHVKTALLPQINAGDLTSQKDVVSTRFGQDTKTAIERGVMSAQVGIVNFAIDELAKRSHVTRDKIKIYLSGGSAELFGGAIPGAEVKKDLNFRGMLALLRG